MVDQIARVRHQHVRGEPAVDLDAEMARRGAEIFLPGLARGAFAAADPGKHRGRCADFHIRVGAGLLDDAGDLVAEREGEGAPRRHVELLVAAEAEIAVVQMQVGVAHAATADPHQHLGAARLRRFHDRLAQRRRIGGHRLADHAGHANSSRERDETFDRNILCARGRVDPGAFEQRNGIDAKLLEALPQHLAALAERRFGDALQRAAVACERGRRAARAEPPRT